MFPDWERFGIDPEVTDLPFKGLKEVGRTLTQSIHE